MSNGNEILLLHLTNWKQPFTKGKQWHGRCSLHLTNKLSSQSLENERSPDRKEYRSPFTVLNALDRGAGGHVPFNSFAKLDCLREFRSRSLPEMVSCRKLLFGLGNRMNPNQDNLVMGPREEGIPGNGTSCMSYVASLVVVEGKPGHLVPPQHWDELTIRCLFSQLVTLDCRSKKR